MTPPQSGPPQPHDLRPCHKVYLLSTNNLSKKRTSLNVMIYLQEACKAHCRGYPECFKYRKLDEMKDVEVYGCGRNAQPARF